MEKQIKVAQEIVDTEVTYVENLKLLHFMFAERLKNHNKLGKEILSDQEISDLFMNLPDIYSINSAMCKEFVQLRYKGDEALVNGIGDIILKYLPFMKTYTEYVDNYKKSQKLFEEFCKRKEFSEFLELNEVCAGTNFLSLLILPVQRVPRYVLLMKELLKQSEGAQLKRKEDLHNAVAELESAAGDINLNVKKSEARKRVVNIQQEKFKNTIHLVAPHRFVIASGNLKKVSEKKVVKKSELCFFVLFNDIIIWGIKAKNSFKFKRALPLERVKASPVTTNITKGSESAFSIICTDPTVKPITVIATSADSRDKWVNIIRTKAHELQIDSQRNGTPCISVQDLHDEIMTGNRTVQSKRSTMISNDSEICSNRASRSITSHGKKISDLLGETPGSPISPPKELGNSVHSYSFSRTQNINSKRYESSMSATSKDTNCFSVRSRALGKSSTPRTLSIEKKNDSRHSSLSSSSSMKHVNSELASKLNSRNSKMSYKKSPNFSLK